MAGTKRGKRTTAKRGTATTTTPPKRTPPRTPAAPRPRRTAKAPPARTTGTHGTTPTTTQATATTGPPRKARTRNRAAALPRRATLPDDAPRPCPIDSSTIAATWTRWPRDVQLLGVMRPPSWDVWPLYDDAAWQAIDGAMDLPKPGDARAWGTLVDRLRGIAWDPIREGQAPSPWPVAAETQEDAARAVIHLRIEQAVLRCAAVRINPSVWNKDVSATLAKIATAATTIAECLGITASDKEARRLRRLAEAEEGTPLVEDARASYTDAVAMETRRALYGDAAPPDYRDLAWRAGRYARTTGAWADAMGEHTRGPVTDPRRRLAGHLGAVWYYVHGTWPRVAYDGEHDCNRGGLWELAMVLWDYAPAAWRIDGGVLDAAPPSRRTINAAIAAHGPHVERSFGG